MANAPKNTDTAEAINLNEAPKAQRGRKADGKVSVRARITEEARAKIDEYRWANRVENVNDLYARAIEEFADSL